MVPLLNSDECKYLTKSAQGLMCIGGDKGKQTFLNNLWQCGGKSGGYFWVTFSDVICKWLQSLRLGVKKNYAKNLFKF